MSIDAAAGDTALQQAAQRLGLELDRKARERLLCYLQLLARWNGTYNLTAVRDEWQMLVQHLFDCLAVVQPLAAQFDGGHLLDVGSGGGLPGVVLAVAMPGLQVTSVDAVAKKAAFVRQVAAELRLANLNAVHARVEQLKGGYDVIASRAFASLADFCRLTAPLLSPGGRWMAMKGKTPVDEMQALPPEVEVFHVEQLQVPDLHAERCIVWMRHRAV